MSAAATAATDIARCSPPPGTGAVVRPNGVSSVAVAPSKALKRTSAPLPRPKVNTSAAKPGRASSSKHTSLPAVPKPCAMESFSRRSAAKSSKNSMCA